ncbi:PGG domain [Sesbania bispinosa]|nr:PGG domain [Sesbania bispinosa]
MERANANTATSPTQAQEVQIASVRPSIELTTSSPQTHVVQISSAQSRHPSLHLIKDKKKYLEQCVPFYKVALRGEWNAAKRMIDADNMLLNAAITKDYGTLLHVVAGTNHVHFVEELVKLLNPDDLELQNYNKNTPFCVAAACGNVQIAAIMIKKNGCLPHIRGAGGVTPLYMAAISERSDMTRYLYTLTADILEEEDLNALFFLCIKNDLYDSCLQMLQKQSTLVLVRNEYNETGLHVLAKKVSGSSCQGMQPSLFLQLVGCLWSMLLNIEYTEAEMMRTIISHPSQITFDATEIGNFHFVAELMRSDPDLIWEVDGKNRSIIHIAVLHRHSSIFNLIHELSCFKYLVGTLEDDEENNILHYAAKLAPPYQLNLISGEALQMTHELLWFEEVKKLMLPSEIEKKNSNGKTPGELFAEEHKDLLTKAESWTKSTANNCMLISTVISTGVFTATFSIPGGNNKNTGTPNYLQKPAFLIFAISDATALISSSASILIFLSILISSYAEYDYFKSLPFNCLLYEQEVKKIMQPSYIEKINSNGKTPPELFTEEFLTKAESWMKSTANSCMVVSTLIATGVFAALFSIPGGDNDKTGTPNFLTNQIS